MSAALSHHHLPSTYHPRAPPPSRDMDIFQKLLFSPAAERLSMHFIMPNGIIIIQEVSTTISLAELKAELWEKAREYPLYGLLHDMTGYHFAMAGSKSGGGTGGGTGGAGGGVVELLDEEKTLREAAPFLTFLQVIERKGNEAEKILNKDIGHLIGKSLSDFVALKNPEVNEFRWKMKAVCDEVVKERAGHCWNKRVQYKYPCSLEPSPTLPAYLQEKLKESDGFILVSVRFAFPVRSVKSMFTLKVEPDILPDKLMELALSKFNTLEANRQTVGHFDKANYIFKVLGREEYLVEEAPLCQYVSMQQHLATKEHQPLPLLVVERSTLDVDEGEQQSEVGPPDSSTGGVRNSFSSMTLSKKKNLNAVSSWTVNESFRVELGNISNFYLIGQANTMVRVVGGLYHGTLPLCANQQTELLPEFGDTVEVCRDLTFDIAVCDLPRSARLCLAIFEETLPSRNHQQSQQLKNKKHTAFMQEGGRGVAWVNTSVFDYRRSLRRGAMTLYCWSEQHHADLPRALGTVVGNPDHDTAIALTVTFPRFHATCEVFYPAHATLLEHAAAAAAVAAAAQGLDPADATAATQGEIKVEPTEKDASLLEALLCRDPLYEVHEQDRKRLWSLRWYCAEHVPHSLPRLLQCVDWNTRIEVAQITALLEKWPKLDPENSLELLDCNFAEPIVRDYAVECISKFSDEDLLLYLLQLTQALKHENHLYCTLAEFLLHRALNNTKIGHFFFWHLRSEMHEPSVSIRFGLILEAYCKGAQEHMKLLTRQLHALDRIRELRESTLRVKGGLSKEKARDALQELLKTPAMQSAFVNFRNLLQPTRNLSNIRADKCRAMDSKMAPLWLVFECEEDDVSLLYKHGDDLRQDMLTLQTIRIMDKLWKSHGMDFRMNPYSCMSTANMEGLIEGVRCATTIANIQRDKGMVAATCPFRKGSLLEWLREKNNTEASLNKAVREFTLSCAGYCVATYVLGIADRHSDNIMIMENGQLFHIDFGHILGHFKEKFGFKREHQPFVLTHDFIYVITKGSNTNTKQSDEFENFKQYCEKAFMCLRKNGPFIISLFAMMISTGLQELQDERDLDYIKNRLQLGLSDDEALAHFRNQFAEAMKNSWKTSLNWAFHAISKDNR